MKPAQLHKILIIQTAFIGDVVLATPLIEALHTEYPNAQIDFLLRKGNESLLINHPKINKVLIWNKKDNKIANLFKVISSIRKVKYDAVFNAQRFFSSGLITVLSGARYTTGFDKNPLSFAFGKSYKHEISVNVKQHETLRNLQLIGEFVEQAQRKIKLYPSKEDFNNTAKYKNETYIIIAASSVWFTKQFPMSKWVEFVISLNNSHKTFFIGGPNDRSQADEIINQSKASNCINLCGQLSMLESAALMQDAAMNYVNDSAPMHFASAMNAAVCAVFCSTVPAFGFGPVSDQEHIVEIEEELNCRPCGLHGKKACPEKHFKCAMDINNEQLLSVLN